jgi:hypothetical protein
MESAQAILMDTRKPMLLPIYPLSYRIDEVERDPRRGAERAHLPHEVEHSHHHLRA